MYIIFFTNRNQYLTPNLQIKTGLHFQKCNLTKSSRLVYVFRSQKQIEGTPIGCALKQRL